MSIKIVNLASYTTPKVKEVKNREWVAYGEDNNYYQYLIDRYNGSPTNNAAINGISQLIYGLGLDATDSSRKPDHYAEMKSLFSDDCVQKLVNDFKLLGQCAIQVIYNELHTEILMVDHFPVETLRAEKANEEGEVTGYYYHPNWAEQKRNDVLKRIPAFGTSKEGIEILYVKPYKTGFYYYSPVDYQGGLQYAELEEEISNYHLNNIMNGLAPSMLINFNNGVPDEEQRELIESRIYEKFSGTSNAGKFILAFNDDINQSASIMPVQLSDAHMQYQFLSDESMRKIMVAHRIVSPMLLGIKDNTGFGNNADELKTASQLMDNTVVRPFQNLLIKAFDEILSYNDISLDLYFKTLQPIEFTDLDNAMTKEQVEQETGQKLSKVEMSDMSDEILGRIYDKLEQLGESEDLENWEVVDERAVDYDQEETLDKMIGLASTGRAIPNASSDQDDAVGDKFFKVRYKYSPESVSLNSRDFCQMMVNAGKIYRKEDIQAMGEMAVNAGFGENGAATYDIWLYKGGPNCHHYWKRVTYRAVDVKPDVNNPNAEITVNKARKEGLQPEVNDALVARRPIDMPNQGYKNPR